jgi:hypothetical protein
MATAASRTDTGHRTSRRYLSLALESVRTTPLRRRLAARLALTDGPFAETKEKAFGGS